MTTTSITPAELLDRWDAQQTAYIRHRAERFETMARVIAHLGKPDPRVLDLACGPGSLTRLVRGRFPESRVVAVDKDPVLLALARDVFEEDQRVTIAGADLDDASWTTGIDGQFDAVISSTALHWLNPEVLVRVYYELAELIVPGGVFLNGDNLYYDEFSHPAFRRIAADDDLAQQQASFKAGADTWEQWWELTCSRPEYAGAVAERKLVWEETHTPTPKVTLGYHLEALRSAGFREVGTVWQHLDDYVVAGVR